MTQDEKDINAIETAINDRALPLTRDLLNSIRTVIQLSRRCLILEIENKQLKKEVRNWITSDEFDERFVGQ